ncbi:dehydrogenase [Undibacterium sp. Ji67W]|uniref:GHMP family kinase ATP-binding protein n=1 Tax=Undibacterium sp. Ji67W TaxID=3413042 RepID=UPI003BF150C6
MIIRSKAPLRLGLAGGGTDVSPYCDVYGGAVLNASIGMYAYAHLEELQVGQITFTSLDLVQTEVCELSKSIPCNGRMDLYKHIFNRLTREFDFQLRPFKLITHSDAPYGSGLGGSSTMVVAILQCFVEWLNLPLGEYDIAQLAYSIEREDAGLKGGKQDQYAATFGGVNYMEFYADRVIVNPLRIKREVINELEASLVLCFSGKSRESANIIEAQINNAKRNDQNAVEAMHKVKADSVAMKEALLTKRLGLFAEILDSSWSNKKKMAESITNSQIDSIYDLAKMSGAIAGKVSGAGGGGFMVFMAKPEDKVVLKNALRTNGYRAEDVNFTEFGVQSWIA